MVPTFSFANGRVFESMLEEEELDSKLLVDSLRFSLLIAFIESDSGVCSCSVPDDEWLEGEDIGGCFRS